MRFRKNALMILSISVFALVGCTSYLSDCKRQTLQNFKRYKNIALYDKWCLNEADRNALLQTAEIELDGKTFEALLKKGLVHRNPDCARLKFAIFDEDINRVKAMAKNGVDTNCTSLGIRPRDFRDVGS